MLVVWNDEHTTGDEIIDSGHHLVIETVNRLNAATTPAQCQAVVNLMLLVLEDHLTRQFQHEEALLARLPGRDAHLAEHRDFLSVLATLKDAHAKGQNVSDMLLLNLVCFLGQHLRGTDRTAFALPQRRAA